MAAVEASDPEECFEPNWQSWIGKRVSIGGVKSGVLRYFGTTQFAEGLWCGVELDEPVGKNDGSVKNVRYFACKERHGIFAPSTKTVKVYSEQQDNSEKHFYRNFRKSKLPSPKVKKKSMIFDSNGLHNDFSVMSLNEVQPNQRSNCESSNTFYDKQLQTFDLNSKPSHLKRYSENFNVSSRKNLNMFKCYTHNDFCDVTNCKRLEQKSSLPLNVSYTIPTQRNLDNNQVDIFNETVVLDQENLNLRTDHFITNSEVEETVIFCNRNNILNSTFNSENFHTEKNFQPNIAEKLENTFISDKLQGQDKSPVFPVEKIAKPLVNDDDLISSEFDESLGILSESQMQEFTLLEQGCSIPEDKLPKLPKIESCDDVNDLPEFEENQSTVIPLNCKTDDVFTACQTETAYLKNTTKSKSNKDHPIKKVVPNLAFVTNNLFSNGNNEGNMAEAFNDGRMTPTFEFRKGSSEFSYNSPCFEGNFDIHPACTSTPAGHLKFAFENEKCIHLSDDENFDLNSFSGTKKKRPSGFLFHISTLDRELQSTPKTSSMIAFEFPDSQKSKQQCFNQFVECAPRSDSNQKVKLSPEIHMKAEKNNFESDIGSSLINKEEIPDVAFNMAELSKITLSKTLDESTKMQTVLNSTDTLNQKAFNLNDHPENPISSSCLDMKNSEIKKTLFATQDDLLGANKKDILNPNATFEIFKSKVPESDKLESNQFNTKTHLLLNKTYKGYSSVNNNTDVDKQTNDPEICSSDDTAIKEHCPSSTQLFSNYDLANICSPDLGKTVCISENEKKLINLNCSNEKHKHFNFLEGSNMPNEILNKTFDCDNANFKCRIDNNILQDETNEEKCQKDVLENETSKVIDSELCDTKDFEICDTEKAKCDVVVQTSNSIFYVESATSSTGHEKKEECDAKTSLQPNSCENDVKRVENMNPKITSTAATTKNKNISDGKHPDTGSHLAIKNPKRNVVSKIKQMIETKKSNPVNQENTKGSTQNQKKGKYAEIAMKLAASIAEEKNKPKEKKVIISKINTNRGNLPQVKPVSSSNNQAEVSENLRKSSMQSVATKNVKNTLNKQRIVDRNETNKCQESKVLTQLQNVEPSVVKSGNFKVPAALQAKKREKTFTKAQELISPDDAESCASSQISTKPVKAPLLPKKNLSKTQSLQVPKNQRESIGVVLQKTAPEKNIRYSIGGTSVQSTAKDSDTTPDNKIIRQSDKSKMVAPPIRTKTDTKATRPLPNSKAGNVKRTCAASKPPVPQDPKKKFVSKAELVKEIQQLNALCESRTKELPLLKMQLRQATLGFEALAIVSKYITEEYDPFSRPQLAKEYQKAQEELLRAGAQLQLYQVQLEQLKQVHADELIELTEKLGTVHSDEINELKMKHKAELEEVDFNHKQQIRKMKANFRVQSEESETQHFRLVEELQEEFRKEKKELEDAHAKKLSEVIHHHEEIQTGLQNQLKDLRYQYDTLQKQVKEAEKAFLMDKNCKIQYMSSKKAELEKEVDSLKAVLEMKSMQIQDLNKQKFEMQKELEELPTAKEKIKQLEIKTEDLRALIQEKVRMQRELSNENQQLMMVCEKETRANNRLSLVNEELQWRLQQSMEASIRSSSISGSPEMWSCKESPSESTRSSSRMSLPILQSDMQRNLTGDTAETSFMTAEERPSQRSYSMSLSWHPALPTHTENESAQKSSPVRRKSSSAKIRTTSFHTPPKFSSYKLKKDIEAEFLKRNSIGGKALLSSRRPLPANSSMCRSWAGENIADFYEYLDDSYVQIFTPRQRGFGRVEDKVKPKCDEITNDKTHLFSENKEMPSKKTEVLESDMVMEVDQSLTGATSLQSSFNSSTDSSGSYLPNQSSEASSCSIKSAESNDASESGSSSNNLEKSCVYELGSYVKSPRELAGEAMVQDVDSLANIPTQLLSADSSNEQNKLVNVKTTGEEILSPDDTKEKGPNGMSIGTISLESSSLGMADSTNIDVSWGDDDMPSDHDN